MKIKIQNIKNIIKSIKKVHKNLFTALIVQTELNK